MDEQMCSMSMGPERGRRQAIALLMRPKNLRSGAQHGAPVRSAKAESNT